MAKGKILKVITEAKGGVSKKVRYKLPKSSLKIQYQARPPDVILQDKCEPTKKRTYKQHEQRTLYCDCDLLYKLLKARFYYIMLRWYNNLKPEEKKTLTMNNSFMKRCLRRNLRDLLFDFFYINISGVSLYEENGYIVIKAKLYQMSQEEYLESFLEPLRLKY